jgi:hypothetical protein
MFSHRTLIEQVFHSDPCSTASHHLIFVAGAKANTAPPGRTALDTQINIEGETLPMVFVREYHNLYSVLALTVPLAEASYSRRTHLDPQIFFMAAE